MKDIAVKRVRKIIESTYQGILFVTEHQKKKNDTTKITAYEDVMVLEDQPCKLSFERIQAASQSESAASVAQITKIFVSPNIIIKPGSKITVTQAGVTADYKSSGIPAVYPTHQEIILNLFEGWA